jgi:MtN3 and saliva related transmembrane protein
MSLTDALGFAAAALTTGSFVPQAWLTLRTRDVSGISLAMYGALTAGVALWLVYGLVLRSWPVVVANSVTLVLASTILGLKIAVERQRAKERPGG